MICSCRPLPDTTGLAVMSLSMPFNSMVPSAGWVVTVLVTKGPSIGIAFCTDSLMPSDVQVMLASSAPMVPLEVGVDLSWTFLMLRSIFMPLASRIWLPAV